MRLLNQYLTRHHGAHRSTLSGRARIAAAATVAALSVGGGALAVGVADAQTGNPNVLLVGRVCSSNGHPPGTVTYDGARGDHGTTSVDHGRYAIWLRHVARSGEHVTLSTSCPGPRPTRLIRLVKRDVLVEQGFLTQGPTLN